MKKSLLVFFAVIFVSCLAFAGQFNTVPLDNEAYRIIEYAEVHGIIPVQSKVKPYDYNTVINLLEQISASPIYNEDGLFRISYVMSDLDRVYSKAEIKAGKDVLCNGLYRTTNAENGNTFAIGVKGKMDESIGFDNDKNKIADLRNTGTVFFSGDLFDSLSFNMNASLKLDMLNPRAYLTEEFVYDADGDYFLGAGSDNTYVNKFTNEADGVHLGFKASPEVSLSLFRNNLMLRFGSFPRNWGPGIGNLVLTETAPEFNGIEMQMKPVPWFTFSSLTGSLSRSYVESIYGKTRVGYETVSVPSGTSTPTDKSIAYDNMFSMQRLEFNIKQKIQIALFESVVWKRRLELAYLNPFSVYWFTQSMTGDIDSLIGGIDFTWNIKKIGQLYFALSVDEFTSDLKHLLTNARNIVALQGGIKLPGNLLGNFTTFTLQGTYIPPFYGTHHYQEADDGTWYASSYVNKGFNLFYPLTPDSLELLFKCDVSLKKGYGLSVTARNQMRSSQYSIGDDGTDVMTVMVYDYSDDYANKKFFKNIWNNVFDLNVTLSKRFDKYPIKITAGIDGIFEWTRNYEKNVLSCPSSRNNKYYRYNGAKYNLGRLDSVDGKDWGSADVRCVGNITFTMYY